MFLPFKTFGIWEKTIFAQTNFYQDSNNDRLSYFLKRQKSDSKIQFEH